MTAFASLDAGRPRPHATYAKAFRALFWRDLLVWRQDAIMFLIKVLSQPVLLTFTFAFVLPKVGTGVGGSSAYATTLVPGLVAVAIANQGLTSVMMPLLMELTYKDIEDRALAPIPLWSVAVQKIISAGFQGLLSGAVVFPVVMVVHAKGQAPDVHVHNWPLFLAVLILSSMLAASCGLVCGTLLEIQKASTMIVLIVLPMTMFGCVYYSWSALHSIEWLQYAVLINPVVYMSEGMRASLTPQLGHMPIWAVLGVLTLGVAAVGSFACHRFVRRIQS
ncbi:ABC transporter permease [Streptomyces sp. BK340]|uniref:ABC transporter permease n=1 Tax=Streptomyces sp. BK340 TaxID=2572903 RepID=UPI0011A17A58|nr:ABC transporter permease [Streptomyces sp. BK340]TVZ80501.1 ABC-2 type transport system permease protein [Streptomyces sp. BK340]